MRSSIRNALILGIVVILLVAGYIILSNKKPADTEEDTTSTTIKVIDVKTDDIKELILENKDGKFVFTQETVKEKDQEGKDVENKVWKAIEPTGLKADSTIVTSIAINFSSIIADKVIEENATDLAKYGLIKPITISAKMKDGTVKAIELGDLTPTKGAYYFKEKDKTKVYTLGTYTAEKFAVSKLELKDKTLYTIKPEDLLSISMERKGQIVFSSKKQTDTEWLLTAPIQGNADTAALGPMQQAIAQTAVINFIDENPSDLSKYGLTNPAYAFDFTTSTMQKRLLLGSEKEKGSEVYAKFADSPEVFTISEQAYTFLDKPLEEIIEVFAYIVNISDVNKIVTQMDGQTVTSEITTDKDDKDKDKFVVNGQDVTGLKDDKDSQYFRKYYQGLIGITLSKIDADAKPTGKPEVTFTYYLKKAPGVMKVDFISKDETYYYVNRNDQYTGILVEKKKLDQPEGVRDTYKLLKDAMDKAK